METLAEKHLKHHPQQKSSANATYKQKAVLSCHKNTLNIQSICIINHISYDKGKKFCAYFGSRMSTIFRYSRECNQQPQVRLSNCFEPSSHLQQHTPYSTTPARHMKSSNSVKLFRLPSIRDTDSFSSMEASSWTFSTSPELELHQLNSCSTAVVPCSHDETHHPHHECVVAMHDVTDGVPAPQSLVQASVHTKEHIVA